MNLGILGNVAFDIEFGSRLASIILIDLILAGDNAVVIAMAVRSLPRPQRRKGIALGSAAAVMLRVIATFFVSQLLAINFIKLIGGIVILWIAIQLFMQGVPEEAQTSDAASLSQAIRIIVIADITMATDNMLAVAGASQGNMLLLLLGLGLSIPFVVFTSNLLSLLMDRFPFIIYIGAAVLGKVGGELIMTDAVTTSLLNPGRPETYAVEAFCAAGVILIGRLWLRRRSAPVAEEVE